MVDIRQNNDEYCEMQFNKIEGHGFRAISRLSDIIDYMITSDEIPSKHYTYAREYIDDKMDELQNNIRNMNTSFDAYINNGCNAITNAHGITKGKHEEIFNTANNIYSLAEEINSHLRLLSEPFRAEIDNKQSEYWKGFFNSNEEEK